MRSKTGYAKFGYFHCYLKMDAPRALVFRPLVKGNEALGTRLRLDEKDGKTLRSSLILEVSKRDIHIENCHSIVC